MVRARGQDGGVGRPRAHLIDAKDWNPAEKNHRQLQIQRRKHHDRSRRGGDTLESRSTSQGRQLTNGKIITMQRFSPRSEGSEPHIRLPSLVVLQGEAPRTLALKAIVAYFGETHRVVGNRDATLKECPKKSRLL